MNMKKWNLLLMITCMLGVSFLLSSKNAAAETLKGKCGPHATWTYNTESEVLKVTGTGAINKKIALSHYYIVSEIVIGEGITTLGSCAPFYDFRKRLTDFRLPNSLKIIETNSLKGLDLNDEDSDLTLKIPKNVKRIEAGAFWNTYIKKISITKLNKYYTMKNGVIFSKNMRSLVYYSNNNRSKKYTIPKTVSTIKPLAFARNNYLKKLFYRKSFATLAVAHSFAVAT